MAFPSTTWERESKQRALRVAESRRLDALPLRALVGRPFEQFEVQEVALWIQFLENINHFRLDLIERDDRAVHIVDDLVGGALQRLV